MYYLEIFPLKTISYPPFLNENQVVRFVVGSSLSKDNLPTSSAISLAGGLTLLLFLTIIGINYKIALIKFFVLFPKFF